MPGLVIIPTYNEADNVREIVGQILSYDELKVLIVDDDSPDGTGQIADQLAAATGRVQVIHRNGRLGFGSACLAGFRHGVAGGYDPIITMDADLSHDPAYLPEMLLRLQSADVVIGSRYVRGGGTANWGIVRRLISFGGSAYARMILGVKTRDLTAGFVGYRRDKLAALQLDQIKSNGYSFQIEMKWQAIKAGYTLEEMPIVFVDRRAGKSKMSANIVWEAIFAVWRIRLQS